MLSVKQCCASAQNKSAWRAQTCSSRHLVLPGAHFNYDIVDVVQVVEEGGAGMANVSKTLALDRLGKRLPFGRTYMPCLVHSLGSCLGIFQALSSGAFFGSNSQQVWQGNI